MREFLKKLREKLGLSQAKFGELAGKTQASISRLESDHSASGFDVIETIATVNKCSDVSPMVWTRWLAGAEGEAIWKAFEHVLYTTAETYEVFEKALDEQALKRQSTGGSEAQSGTQVAFDVWVIGHNPPECHSKVEFEKTVRRLIRGNSYVYWIPESHLARMRTLMVDLRRARDTNIPLQKVDFDARIKILTAPPTMGLLPLWFADPLAEQDEQGTLGFASFDVGKRTTRFFVLPEVTTDSLIQDVLKPIYHRVIHGSGSWEDKVTGFHWKLVSPSELLTEH